MIGAAVGVGYAAGVGVSTVTATLRSNVLASSMGEINSRYITVAAKSNTGDAYRGKDAEDRKNAIGDLLQGAASDEGQAIRVIAATMSAAAVGIGVANGTLNTDNITSATLGGRVNDVRSLTITADHDYDNVLMGRELETPLPMRIVLRGHHIDGADLPVYSLTDRFFAMCDGTDGKVSLFDGFYTNTFDGDTFDSDYIRIEGGLDGDLNVIIKEDQPIWPEWIGDDEAEDIVGNHYTRQDNVWYNSDGIPIPEDARTV
ncbi:MAG: hypothetical protein IJ124_09625 [Clostridia bacterium]|nr:hypothetical protein [Clostridia bacterium]